MSKVALRGFTYAVIVVALNFVFSEKCCTYKQVKSLWSIYYTSYDKTDNCTILNGNISAGSNGIRQLFDKWYEINVIQVPTEIAPHRNFSLKRRQVAYNEISKYINDIADTLKIHDYDNNSTILLGIDDMLFSSRTVVGTTFPLRLGGNRVAASFVFAKKIRTKRTKPEEPPGIEAKVDLCCYHELGHSRGLSYQKPEEIGTSKYFDHYFHDGIDSSNCIMHNDMRNLDAFKPILCAYHQCVLNNLSLNIPYESSKNKACASKDRGIH